MESVVLVKSVALVATGRPANAKRLVAQRESIGSGGALLISEYITNAGAKRHCDRSDVAHGMDVENSCCGIGR